MTSLPEHFTQSDYERSWQDLGPETRNEGEVVLLTARAPSSAGGPERDKKSTPIHTQPKRALFARESGMEGDRWKAGKKRESQISLMSARVAQCVATSQEDFHLFGDNLLVDFDLGSWLVPGDRLAIGDVVLEITDEPHTACDRYEVRFGSEARAWIGAHPERYLRGRYAFVVQAGSISVGDLVRKI